VSGIATFTQVAVGGTFSCGLANGQVACWGELGSVMDASTPTLLNY